MSLTMFNTQKHEISLNSGEVTGEVTTLHVHAGSPRIH